MLSERAQIFNQCALKLPAGRRRLYGLAIESRPYRFNYGISSVRARMPAQPFHSPLTTAVLWYRSITYGAYMSVTNSSLSKLRCVTLVTNGCLKESAPVPCLKRLLSGLTLLTFRNNCHARGTRRQQKLLFMRTCDASVAVAKES